MTEDKAFRTFTTIRVYCKMQMCTRFAYGHVHYYVTEVEVILNLENDHVRSMGQSRSKYRKH
jgi:hypothetical protein